jgi:ATP-dependent Lon protease
LYRQPFAAARISRIERVSSTTVINGVSTSQHDYVITLQGICRVRIDRFTQVGTPFFQALVTAFPASSSKLSANIPEDAAEAIPQDLVDRMADLANNILDILAAVAGSSTPSNKASRTPSIPSPTPPLPALAIKRLRSALKGMTTQNADDISDLLLSSLLPSNRQASYPAKLHHLSLYAGSERVLHACSQLETLKTELDSREAVGVRYANNMTRKTKEMVLRGLMEAIRQELLALRRQQQDGDDDDGASSSGSNSGIRVIRVGNGNPNNPLGSPTASSSGQHNHNEDEDEEQDELANIGQKIHDSTMPPEARTIALREFKRLKTIPPQSIEHGGIRNYLDWLIDLPWGTSSNSTISNDFLNKAKKQLDDDHFGIDRVKERLLQYLAVLRLRNEAFENEEIRWREEEKRLAEEAEKKMKEEEEKAAAAKAAAKPEDEAKSKAVVPYESGKDDNKRIQKRSPPASPTSTAMVKQQPRNKPEDTIPRVPRPQRKDKGPILLLV